ncbi:DUF2510 domain-containing protein [Mycolicibacterium smegmatis]|uniref:DUF2510 domain-containing protein n=1 Tax=Mycolicibacterium smegmatis TaxID=1772 RepID=UPI001E41E509|nr:DUF2510 domain-containing protein [Mycolicibacterium smegmatis]
MVSQHTPGLPLGQKTLRLRENRGRIDGDHTSSVDNADGVPVALVRFRTRVPWMIGRNRRTLEFDVIGPDGTTLFAITRHGGRRHRIQVDGAGGYTLGRLQQVTSSWRQFRAGRITFAVEADEQPLATADLGIVPSDNRFTDVEEPIRDQAGDVIAAVLRQGRYTGERSDAFSYWMECPQRTAEPLPTLLFAVLLTYYLYDRMALGGLFGIARPVPSWENPRYTPG